MPEIYYTSQAFEWGEIYQAYPDFFLLGVTTENGAENSLNWSDAWNALNNQMPDEVAPAAIDIKW